MGLLKDIAQIKAVSRINVNNTLDQWQPYLDEAEETFVKPILGDALFNQLNEYEQGSSESEDLWQELLSKVYKPIALYALNLGADEMSISVSGQGLQVVQTDTHKSAPQYMVQNLKENWMRRAHTAMDALLKFLESNKSTFTSYVSAYNELFIPCAEDFQKHQDIHSSRRVYITLLPVIRSIEKKYIRPTLSVEYFNELKDALESSTGISEDDQAVIDLIQPALAHLTIARALQEISIDFLDWGIFQTASSTFDNVTNKQTANKDKIAVMQKACEFDGEAELKELQQYLDTNAGDSRYKTYYDSDRCLKDGSDPVKRNQFENLSTNSFFLV